MVFLFGPVGLDFPAVRFFAMFVRIMYGLAVHKNAGVRFAGWFGMSVFVLRAPVWVVAECGGGLGIRCSDG